MMNGPSVASGAPAYATSADMNAKVDSAAAKLAGDWSDLPEGHVLLKLSAALPDILAEADYAEMYGVQLEAPAEGQAAAPFTTLIILQKFLRANENTVSAAAKQLIAALKWRKEFKPLEIAEEVFPKDKFHGLGYVVQLKDVPGSTNESDVCTFNIYGAIKDTKKTFGDLDGFIKWRVALMELTLRQLHFQDAKMPIPDFGHGADPYQAYQVHDYLSVSFLRQPAEVKTASQKTIKLFQDVYPETMAKKYFVNVPIFMQWMFAAMQIFMAKETLAKMKWMSYGKELHEDLGPNVPTPYGGSGADLFHKSSVAPKYDGDEPRPVTVRAPSRALSPTVVAEAIRRAQEEEDVPEIPGAAEARWRGEMDGGSGLASPPPTSPLPKPPTASIKSEEPETALPVPPPAAVSVPTSAPETSAGVDSSSTAPEVTRA